MILHSRAGPPGVRVDQGAAHVAHDHVALCVCIYVYIYIERER